MEIVINIPEEAYNLLKNKGVDWLGAEHILNAVVNGTPLPKGHGNLVNVDELHNIFEKNCDAYNIDNLSFISDMNMHFDLAQSIIEADKEN